MNVRSILAGAALAVIGSTASATAIDFSTTPNSAYGVFSGTGTDSFSFATVQDGSVTGAAVSILLRNGPGSTSGFNITSVSLDGLYSFVGHNTVVPGDPTIIFDSWSLSNAALTAGPHSISVVGHGTGMYTGSVQLTSAVPEPETYALALAGLGVIGFVGRRRSGKGAQSPVNSLAFA